MFGAGSNNGNNTRRNQRGGGARHDECEIFGGFGFGLGLGDSVRIQQQNAVNLFFMQNGNYDVNYQMAMMNAVIPGNGLQQQLPQGHQMQMPTNANNQMSGGAVTANNRSLTYGGNAGASNPNPFGGGMTNANCPGGMFPNANAHCPGGIMQNPHAHCSGGIMQNPNARFPPAGNTHMNSRAAAWVNGQHSTFGGFPVQQGNSQDAWGSQYSNSPSPIEQDPEQEFGNCSQLSQCSQRSCHN